MIGKLFKKIQNTTALLLQNLKRNFIKEIFLGIGVIVGVIIIIVANSFGDGFERLVQKSFLGKIPTQDIKLRGTASTGGLLSVLNNQDGQKSKLELNNITKDRIKQMEDMEGVKNVIELSESTFPLYAATSKEFSQYFGDKGFVTELIANGIPEEIAQKYLSEAFYKKFPEGFKEQNGVVPVLLSDWTFQIIRNLLVSNKLPQFTKEFVVDVGFQFNVYMGRSIIFDNEIPYQKENKILCQVVGFADVSITSALAMPIDVLNRFKQQFLPEQEAEASEAVFVRVEEARYTDSVYKKIEAKNKGIGSKQFRFPTGLTTDEGRIYIADTDHNRVQVFDRDFNFLYMFGDSEDKENQLKQPLDIAIDNKGFLYICDTGNSRICKFSNKGEFIKAFTGKELISPVKCCVEKGKLYVIDNDNVSLNIYSLNGNLTKEIDLVELSNPYSISIDDNIYIVDRNLNSIFIFDKNYELINAIEESESSFSMIKSVDKATYNEKDALFILDEKSVLITDLNGNTLESFAIDESNDIEINGDSVLLTGSDNRIYEYSTEGEFIQKIGDDAWGYQFDKEYEMFRGIANIIRKTIAAFKTTGMVFGSFIFLLAAMTVFYAFMYLVIRREKEIGLFIFFGSSKAKIILLILLEAAFVGAICAGIGFFVGKYLVEIVFRQSFDFFIQMLPQSVISVLFPTQETIASIKPEDIFIFNNGRAFLTALIGMAISIIATLFPAVKASSTSLYKSINK